MTPEKDLEMEREANMFAMCLLMPEKLVRKWLKDHGPMDFTDDDYIKRLARDFAVSSTIACLRLQQLGIFRI